MNKCIFATIFTCLLCTFKAQAQARAFEIRHDVPLDSIRLSDPAILADQKTKMYYMTGTGGMMWRSPDLKLWEGPYRVTEFDKDSWMGPRPMIWAAELHQTGDGWYYYFATFTNRELKSTPFGVMSLSAEHVRCYVPTIPWDLIVHLVMPHICQPIVLRLTELFGVIPTTSPIWFSVANGCRTGTVPSRKLN